MSQASSLVLARLDWYARAASPERKAELRRRYIEFLKRSLEQRGRNDSVANGERGRDG